MMIKTTLKLTLISMSLISALSYAQNFSQTPASDPVTTDAEGIKETQITHLTLSDKEQAEHFKLSVEDFEKYKKYMALEGKYYYSHLDPVTTLAIIEKDPKNRKYYMSLAVMRERDRVDAEVSFANDSYRIQRDLFGSEDFFDFNKLPVLDGKLRDKTIMYRDPNKIYPDTPLPDLNALSQKINQIYFVMDAKCKNCQEPLQMLINQPLEIVLIMKDSTPEDMDEFYRTYKLKELVTKGRIKIKMYDPNDFIRLGHAEPQLNDLYMGSGGVIVKKVSD